MLKGLQKYERLEVQESIGMTSYILESEGSKGSELEIL
jgi:hypothetical protein